MVQNGGSGRPHPASTGNEESMVGLPSGGVTCGEHAEHAEHAQMQRKLLPLCLRAAA